MNATEFESWLSARPEETRQRDAALIAMRAAARIFPQIENDDPDRDDEKRTRINEGRLLMAARCLLTAGAATTAPRVELQSAAYVAASARFALVSHINLLSGLDSFKAARHAARILTMSVASEYLAEARIAVADVRSAKEPPWVHVGKDIEFLELGSSISLQPLWAAKTPSWFVVADEKLRIYWASDPDHVWDFWARWWDGLVTGRPLDGALQEKVALIPEAIWQQGAAAVARAIREIEEQDGYLVSDETRAKAEKLLRAAIGTFTFNQVRGLITLGPFAEDLAFIKQPEVINRFLVAAADVRERIDALQTSFEQERRGMQGAGALQVYLGKIDEEFSKARQTQVLRVGTLLNWVNTLRNMAADVSTRREISPLHVPLDDLLSGLDDLIRTYFAQALVRVAPLKDIRSDENVPLADLLQDIQRGMDAIRESDGKDLVPLAPEVLAIFDDALADMDLLVRAELSEPTPARRSALRREFDFRAAQVSISWLMYREAALKRAGWAIGAFSKVGRLADNAQNLGRLIDWVMELISPS